MQTKSPQRLVKLLLDPKLGYAPIEREDTTVAGQIIYLARSEQWKYYEGADVWLPARIVQDFYAERWKLRQFSDHPCVSVTYNLSRAEFGRSENVQFNLQAEYKKPATSISDYTAPEAKTNLDHRVDYVVAADGKAICGSAFEVLAEVHDWRVILPRVGALLAILGCRPSFMPWRGAGCLGGRDHW